MNGWRWVLVAWRFVTLVCTPLLALLVLHPRLRARARDWLGFPSVRVDPGGVWLHAASLGEGRAAGVLAAAVRSLHPELPLLRTCTSTTAVSQALPVDQVLAPPLDTPFFVACWLDRVRPRVLVLVEAELWPCLLAGCRARAIPVVVVQARVGPGLRRVRAWPGAWAALTEGVHFFAADSTVGDLLGVVVTGDLKAEAALPPPAFTWVGPAVVAGSTHPGEELGLLEAVEALEPRPLLVLAPRSPARFAEVLALVRGRTTRGMARSELLAEGRKPPNVPPLPSDVEVVVLDSIGELAGIYKAAKVAFVGGTFSAAVGGHSPSEAASAGCVMVAGPERHANPGSWADLEKRGAGVVIGVQAVTELRAALRTALGMALEADASLPGGGGDTSRDVSVAEGSAGAPISSGPIGSGVIGSVPLSSGPLGSRPLSSGPRSGSTAGLRTVAALAPWLGAPIPEERPLRPWLWPLGGVWMLAVRLRPSPLRRASIPVLAVGGITAGGSGKTPVVGWLADVLADRRPVVLARGYGRTVGGDDVRISGGAAELGDELAMLAARGVRVASAPDRAEALTRCLAGEDPPGCAILDDAFSYRGLARGLEIVVVDARWPEGGGPLPVGLRRVPVPWLRRADVVWVNHGPLPERLRGYLRPDALVVRATFVPTGWLRVDVDGARVSFGLDQGPPAPHTVCVGIARPSGFLRTLRAVGVVAAEVRIFPDHHAFGASDRRDLEGLAARGALVTTEKDLARMPPGVPVWALVVRPDIVEGEQELRALIASCVGGALGSA